MSVGPPRPRSAGRAALVRVLLLLLAGGAGLLGWQRQQAQRAQQTQQSQLRDAGAALFHGQSPLPGRLAGHDETLPSMATRCSNCHEDLNRPPAALAGTAVTGAAATTSFAAVLNHDALTRPRSRRGGPPSAFDAVTLCTLLRSGVDPAHVIIPTTMPRYTVSDAQCSALWAHLTQR